MADLTGFFQGIPTFKKIVRGDWMLSKFFGNSIYFNGFAGILREKYKLNTPFVTDAKWIHGVPYQPIQCVGFLDGLRRDTLIVVPNPQHASYLNSLGFYHVIKGGVPFVYVKELIKSKNPHLVNSILAIPSHSFTVKAPLIEYLDYLYEIRKNHEHIFVSLASYSINDNFIDECRSECLKRTLIPLRGSIAEDANSLIRIKYILSSFEHITTNCYGSHIAYSLEAGARVSITGKFFQISDLPKDSLIEKKHIRLFENLFGKENSSVQIERHYNSYDESSARSIFGKFFVADTNSGISDVELGRTLCGSDYILPINVVNSIFTSGALKILGKVIEKVLKRNRYVIIK